MVGVDFERMGSTRFGTYADSEWMLSQTVPIGGRNLSRARAVEAEAHVSYEELRRMRLEFVANARAAYYRLSSSYELLAINRRNDESLEQALEAGRARLSVGKSAPADVLAMETDREKLTVERVALEQTFAEQQTMLNVLMGRPPKTALGEPARLAFKPLSESAGPLEARMLAHRPEIVAAEQRVKAEEARLQLAHREWIPEPQLRVEARHFRGTGDTFTEYDTGIFFSIPWANPRKYSAGVREAGQMVEAVRREADGARNEGLGKLRDQLRKIAAFRRQFEISRDKLVPLARKTAETLQVNYQAGTAGYVELLAAQRMSRDAEASASMQLAEYLAALAELDSIVGADPAPSETQNKSERSKR